MELDCGQNIVSTLDHEFSMVDHDVSTFDTDRYRQTTVQSMKPLQ